MTHAREQKLSTNVRADFQSQHNPDDVKLPFLRENNLYIFYFRLRFVNYDQITIYFLKTESIGK